MASLVDIFCCYAREDQPLLNNLKTHLMPLQRQGSIIVWADTDIGAGAEWEKEIEKHLDTAHIILLLISPDFMSSDYSYSKEMQRAMERHERGEAQIIPVLLRPVYWQGAPFGRLQVVPTDAIPVTSSKWHNLDEAFFDVAEGIRKAVDKFTTNFLRVELGEIKNKVELQQKDIDALQFLVTHFLSDDEYKHLNSLLEERFQYTGPSETSRFFAEELRHLRSMRLIFNKRTIDELIHQHNIDVKDYIGITDLGKDYLKLRKQWQIHQGDLQNGKTP